MRVVVDRAAHLYLDSIWLLFLFLHWTLWYTFYTRLPMPRAQWRRWCMRPRHINLTQQTSSYSSSKFTEYSCRTTLLLWAPSVIVFHQLYYILGLGAFPPGECSLAWQVMLIGRYLLKICFKSVCGFKMVQFQLGAEEFFWILPTMLSILILRCCLLNFRLLSTVHLCDFSVIAALKTVIVINVLCFFKVILTWWLEII